MELFSSTTTIDFMGRRRLAAIISAVLLLVSVISLATRQLEFGIDFTGGTLIEVGYGESVDVETVRGTLNAAGFTSATVQHFGSSRDVLVRIAPREGESRAELSDQVLAALRAGSADQIQMRRVEFVGPQIGAELAEDGGLAMLIALGAIFVYVMFRFEWKFSVGAVAALFHDVIIVLGVFSVLGLEFDLTVLAAVLAVIGYSLNDTIVVFDRVRENFRKMRRGDAEQVINESINQTLSRTIMTGVTTLLVLLALYLVGGELIQGFSIALIIGIVIGTFSSLYVASALTLALGVSRQDLMPVAPEGVEADKSP